MRLAAAVAVGALAVLSGCGASDEEQIRDTVAGFVDAVGDKDAGGACEMLAGELREQLAGEDGKDCDQAVGAALERTSAAERKRLSSAKRAKPRIAGDEATVRLLEVGSIRLRRSDGDWRVVAVPGTGLQQVLAEAYVGEFNRIGKTLERTLSSLGRALSGSTKTEQIAAKLDEGAKALDGAAAKLRGTEPPQDARQAHAKIVDGVGDLAASFRRGAREARADDLNELVRIFSSLDQSAGARKIRQAQKDLRDLGYEVDE